MGLSEGRQALNEAINTGEIPSGPPRESSSAEPVSQDLAPDTNESNNEISSENNQEPIQQQQNKIEDILDLDKHLAGKVMFQGKEWTKEDLRKAFLRQEDYSRKTMALNEQRKGMDNEKKFSENFAADVQNVINNPDLLDKFKELYPSHYHGTLERILQNFNQERLGSSQDKSQTNGQPDLNPSNGQSNVDPALMKRLQAIETEMNFSKQARAESEKTFRAQEVATAEAEISATFDKLSKKYPMADEINCINAGQIYLDQNTDQKKVPTQVWENIFKSVNEMHLEKYKTHYREQIKQQKLANSKGKDSPAGGGTPGSSPVKMRLKDVGEYAARTLSGK